MTNWKVFCVIMGLLSSRLGSAAGFEFVTQEKRVELSRQFSEARAPKLSEIKKTWSCDMYGVKSALQVKRNMSLYRFEHNGEAVVNSGSLPVPEYNLTADGLVGRHEKLRDQVKIKSDGILIAQLSSDSSPISYALCH